MRRLALLGALLAGCSACSHAKPPPSKPAGPDPLAELELAHQADAAGDLTGARSHLEVAVQAAPNLGLAQVDLADVLLRQGDEGPALATALAAAERLEPSNPRVWRIAGAFAEDRGDPSGAISAYEKALALRPSDPRSRFRLAGLYAGSNRTDDAIRAYRAVLELDAGDRASRLALAELLRLRADLAGAEAQLQELVLADPKNALYQRKLQEVLVAEGKAQPEKSKKRPMRPLRKSKW